MLTFAIVACVSFQSCQARHCCLPPCLWQLISAPHQPDLFLLLPESPGWDGKHVIEVRILTGVPPRASLTAVLIIWRLLPLHFSSNDMWWGCLYVQTCMREVGSELNCQYHMLRIQNATLNSFPLLKFKDSVPSHETHHRERKEWSNFS